MSEQLTALILAGGMGRRMGGEDKGLVVFRERPLVEHILDAITPQVDHILINANRNHEHYRRYGHPVVADQMADYQGPLAGFLTAMQEAASDDFITMPCDGPFVPPDLARRMTDARQKTGADITVAHDGERMQPVYALLKRSLRESLQNFIDSGDRKIDRWYAQHHVTLVDFSDCPETFANINRPEDRERLEDRPAPSLEANA